MRWLALGTLVMVFACGDDDRAASDLGPAPDLGGSLDLGEAPEDLGPVADLGAMDLGRASDLGVDMSVAAVDMFAGVDLGADEPVPVPVQCRTDEDCGRGSCNESAPGGICNGCVEGSCPTGTSCSEFGTCIRSCVTSRECAPGFQCLRSGRCALVRPCDATVCPPPYVCGSVGCERPACGADGVCPRGFACGGRYCVED